MDMMNDLISIIVPAYNAEEYLASCLDSILNQTYFNLEIIVINDGSSDSTLLCAKEFANIDKRVRVISEPNRGVSEARNRGIAEANGNYISFVDSDDRIHPYMIDSLHMLANKYSADLCECGIVRTNEDADFAFPESQNEQIYSKEEYLKKFFKIGTQETVYYCYNKLYSREIVDTHMFPNYEIGEDVISTFKAISKSKKIATTNMPLYHYRQGSGITSSFNDKYFQLIQVWDEVIELAKKEGADCFEWAKINRARINFTLLTQIALAGAHRDNRYTEKKNHLIRELKKTKKVLLSSNIDVLRKIGIQLFCFNYDFTASIVNKLVKRKQ